MGLLPKHDEFNSQDALTSDDTATLNFVDEIAKALQIPMMKPKGRNLTAFTSYLKDYSSDQKKLFVEKLKTSSYVRNSAFKLKNIVKWDLIDSLTSGTTKEAGRFYTVQRIYVDEQMSNMRNNAD